MKKQLKNFLAEFRRRWDIVFENRDLEVIRKDFYAQRWISKEELTKLMTYEIQQLTEWALKERQEKNMLMENFQLGTMRAYYEAEEKLVKSGRLF